jgi:hypothetical protein
MKTLNYNIKPIIYWVLLLSVLYWMTSCKAKQNTTETIKTEYINVHTSDTVVINQKINDTIMIEVPMVQTIKPECDSICREAVRAALKKMATTKQSGDNSYGFYFDKNKDALVAFANLGATFNKAKTHEKTQKNSVSETKTKYVDVYPKWLLVLAAIGTFYLGRRLFRMYKFAIEIIKVKRNG